MTGITFVPSSNPYNVEWLPFSSVFFALCVLVLQTASTQVSQRLESQWQLFWRCKCFIDVNRLPLSGSYALLSHFYVKIKDVRTFSVVVE